MKKQIEELKGFSNKELDEELKKAKDELFHLKFQLALKQLENTAKLGQLRNKIAQIHTVKQQRLLAKGEVQHV